MSVRFVKISNIDGGVALASGQFMAQKRSDFCITKAIFVLQKQFLYHKGSFRTVCHV